jgi:hypothetical protein
MPLTSGDEAGVALGGGAESTLCIGPGAMFPSAGGMAVADGGGDKGAAGGAIVCGPATLGIAGTRGNENKSFTGGRTDAAPGDVAFSPSGKYGVAPGITGALPGD